VQSDLQMRLKFDLQVYMSQEFPKKLINVMIGLH